HEPSLVTFGSNGRGQDGGYIEFDPDETRGRLEIIVQSGSRTVAGGVIPVEELWQLAKAPARPCYSPQRTKPKTHSLVDKLARAFSGQSIAESEPLYGNIWVYVTDQNGRSYSDTSGQQPGQIHHNKFSQPAEVETDGISGSILMFQAASGQALLCLPNTHERHASACDRERSQRSRTRELQCTTV
ncbi:hypothetical protein WJX79_007916, partial [Trebouxia sp. C0005]